MFSESTKGKGHPIGEGTVHPHVDDVAKAFTGKGYPNPKFDEDGNTAFLLRRQLKAYKDADPSVQHQKAIPFALIRQMVTRQTTSPMLTVLHQLFLLGFFFAMRSCEYLLVTGPKRRTQPLKKKSFTFIQNGKVLPHDSRYLSRVDSVSVTFEFQKRDDRNDVVAQCAIGDAVFCPVKVAARIVQRLAAMQASDETPIYNPVPLICWLNSTKT
jgi:hypothetical protein